MKDQIFPEPTVGAFIFNLAGELLLLKSHKWPGRYVVPGGHVELGERIEETVIRETREETGLEIYDLEFILFQEFIYDPSFWKPKHFIFFDYACKTNSTDVQLNDEAEEYIWVRLDEAAAILPLDAYTRASIDKLIEATRRLEQTQHPHNQRCHQQCGQHISHTYLFDLQQTGDANPDQQDASGGCQLIHHVWRNQGIQLRCH